MVNDIIATKYPTILKAGKPSYAEVRAQVGPGEDVELKEIGPKTNNQKTVSDNLEEANF